jgi:hypothetical protein
LGYGYLYIYGTDIALNYKPDRTFFEIIQEDGLSIFTNIEEGGIFWLVFHIASFFLMISVLKFTIENFEYKKSTLGNIIRDNWLTFLILSMIYISPIYFIEKKYILIAVLFFIPPIFISHMIQNSSSGISTYKKLELAFKFTMKYYSSHIWTSISLIIIYSLISLALTAVASNISVIDRFFNFFDDKMIEQIFYASMLEIILIYTIFIFWILIFYFKIREINFYHNSEDIKSELSHLISG